MPAAGPRKKLSLPVTLLREIGAPKPKGARRNENAKGNSRGRRAAHQSNARHKGPSSDDEFDDRDEDEIPKRIPEGWDVSRDFDLSESSNEGTSEPISISRAVREKLAQDDAEIARLEKKLGLKDRKSKALPTAFRDDGLDVLLQDLGADSDDASERSKRKAEADDWLARKRRKSEKVTAYGETNADDDLLDEISGSEASRLFDSDNLEDDETGGEDGGGNMEEDEFKGFDDDVSHPSAKRDQEFSTPEGALSAAGKYVPPARRGQSASVGDTQRAIRLVMNRLSESAMGVLLQDFAKIYRENVRDKVISTSTDLILDRVCNKPTATDEAEPVLDAGFAAGASRVIGQDFVRHLISRFVARFQKEFEQATLRAGKHEPYNLVSFLCGLYSLQVIGNQLVFDYIRLLLSELSDLSSALLLRIFRISGPQLRKDNPRALKEVVEATVRVVANTGEKNLSGRTLFMVEALKDLKNNKPSKADTQAFQRISERLKRINDIISAFRSPRGDMTLQIGIREAEIPVLEGKGKPSAPAKQGGSDSSEDGMSEGDLSTEEDDEHFPDIPRLEQLAREQGMNTATRQAIFIAIVGAADDCEGHARVLKLRLNKKQRADVPYVLIQCVGAEEPYNPYYTRVAKRFCKDNGMRQALQYGFWRVLRRMGEELFGEQGEEDGESKVEMREIVGVARMFGTLIGCSLLSLGSLKCLNLVSLREATSSLIEVLLVTVFRECFQRGEQAVTRVFAVPGIPPELASGLQHFLRKVVRNTDLARDKEERKKIKEACKLAIQALAVGLREM